MFTFVSLRSRGVYLGPFEYKKGGKKQHVRVKFNTGQRTFTTEDKELAELIRAHHLFGVTIREIPSGETEAAPPASASKGRRGGRRRAGSVTDPLGVDKDVEKENLGLPYEIPPEPGGFKVGTASTKGK
jgi:hypothetical protein